MCPPGSQELAGDEAGEQHGEARLLLLTSGVGSSDELAQGSVKGGLATAVAYESFRKPRWGRA